MDLANILQNIIHILVFGGEDLSIPQIQYKLSVEFHIHLEQKQIVNIIKNNKQFAMTRQGDRIKVRYLQ